MERFRGIVLSSTNRVFCNFFQSFIHFIKPIFCFLWIEQPYENTSKYLTLNKSDCTIPIVNQFEFMLTIKQAINEHLTGAPVPGSSSAR